MSSQEKKTDTEDTLVDVGLDRNWSYLEEALSLGKARTPVLATHLCILSSSFWIRFTALGSIAGFVLIRPLTLPLPLLV